MFIFLRCFKSAKVKIKPRASPVVDVLSFFNLKASIVYVFNVIVTLFVLQSCCVYYVRNVYDIGFNIEISELKTRMGKQI
jgi:hypothetical protein